MGQFEEQLLNLSHNRSLDYNQCQCLPKAELKTKTNPNGHHFCGRLGSFCFSTRFTRNKVSRLARKTVYIGMLDIKLRVTGFHMIWAFTIFQKRQGFKIVHDGDVKYGIPMCCLVHYEVNKREFVKSYKFVLVCSLYTFFCGS